MLQLLFNLLALTAAYALVALGFVLVLNATSAVNFAHGDFVMIGGYAAWVLAGWLALPAIYLLPIVLVVMMGVGVLLALVAFFPLRGQPPVAIFIATMAVGSMLESSATVAFGSEPRPVPALLGGGAVRLGSASLSIQSIAILVAAAALMAAQFLLINRTRIGQRMRAVAQDPETAATCGINVVGVVAITFPIGAALAGGAGVMLSHAFFVSPSDGLNYMLKAYIAATIGGWGSIPGALVGASIVAVFEIVFPVIPTFLPEVMSQAPAASFIFSESSSLIVLYVVLMIVLFVRPHGIFGKPEQVRA